MTSRRPTLLRPNRGHKPDRKYKAWIREWPCLICYFNSWKVWIREGGELRLGLPILTSDTAQLYPTEAAHTGPRGKGQTADDRTVLPLCSLLHHREGRESHHKLAGRFWAHHDLDRDGLIAALNSLYDAERRAA